MWTRKRTDGAQEGTIDQVKSHERMRRGRRWGQGVGREGQIRRYKTSVEIKGGNRKRERALRGGEAGEGIRARKGTREKWDAVSGGTREYEGDSG